MRADAQTEAAVRETFTRFLRAYEDRDLNGVLSLFTLDPDIVFFGTGADEKRIGPNELRLQIERDFAQSESATFALAWYSISALGPVAWVATDGVGRARVEGRDISFPLRITAVLEKREDKWLFVQSHASLPATTEREGQSFPEPTA